MLISTSSRKCLNREYGPFPRPHGSAMLMLNREDGDFPVLTVQRRSRGDPVGALCTVTTGKTAVVTAQRSSVGAVEATGSTRGMKIKGRLQNPPRAPLNREYGDFPVLTVQRCSRTGGRGWGAPSEP